MAASSREPAREKAGGSRPGRPLARGAASVGRWSSRLSRLDVRLAGRAAAGTSARLSSGTSESACQIGRNAVWKRCRIDPRVVGPLLELGDHRFTARPGPRRVERSGFVDPPVPILDAENGERFWLIWEVAQEELPLGTGRDDLCLGGRRDPEQIVVEPDVVDPGIGDRVIVSLASPPTRERQGTRQGPMKLRSPTAGSCEIEDFGRPCSVRARKSLRIGRRIRRCAAKRNLGPGWCGEFQLRAGLLSAAVNFTGPCRRRLSISLGPGSQSSPTPCRGDADPHPGGSSRARLSCRAAPSSNPALTGCSASVAQALEPQTACRRTRLPDAVISIQGRVWNSKEHASWVTSPGSRSRTPSCGASMRHDSPISR